jgi:hypothetical protein
MATPNAVSLHATLLAGIWRSHGGIFFAAEQSAERVECANIPFPGEREIVCARPLKGLLC